jgi:hypothetical protein
MGLSPGTLTVLPTRRVSAEGKPMGCIGDHVAYTNIATFGLCTSLLNPITASQTSAALGTLTPGTCTPMTMTPWTPASAPVTVGGQPSIDQSSTCQCTYGGTISITSPGAGRTQL